MGLPIDSFEVLHRARGRDKMPSELAAALSKFRVFVIVLHDPVLHSKFHARLVQSFDALDRETGERLLFFALVPPPPAWRDGAGARPYVAAFERLRDHIGYGPVALVGNRDAPSAPLAEALGLASGIELAELPCLLVLRDLCSPEVLALRTSADKLRDQLRDLGKAANGEAELADLRKEFSADIIERSVPDGPGDAKPVAGSLADVLAVTVPNRTWRGPIAADALAVMKLAMNAAVAALQAARQPGPGDADSANGDRVDRAARLLADLVVLATTTTQTPYAAPIESLDEAHLEPESRMWLRNALHYAEHSHLVASMLAGTERAQAGPMDASACVNGVGKAFEHEMNLSIAQEVRRRLGIPMGRYYNIKWPGAERVGHRCQMNQAGRDKTSWRSPGLGRLLEEARAEKSRQVPYFDEAYDQWIFGQWAVIAENRNLADHTARVEYDRFQRVRDVVSDLAKRGFFARTHAMKASLRRV